MQKGQATAYKQNVQNWLEGKVAASCSFCE